MLFSSSIFLFYFLPVLLLCYFIAPDVRTKNKVLLFFSFIFFAWGGIWFTLILICSIVFNFFIGLGIEKSKARLFLITGVGGNLALLIWFKYANFLGHNLNMALSALQKDSFSFGDIALPIGISFYTFHSISYLADIFNKKVPAQKNIYDMALYIILFTQLVAGPIIRYNVFAPQLFNRKTNFFQFGLGIERFIIGLGKKVLIANTLARVADVSFQQSPDSMSTLLSWTGAVCYAFQIYFDFSGYSDMAIGLSKMFGFEFPENFNKPYTAASIKDFWKRWHISLSSFFRDYVYFPLGGSKKGKFITYRNLIIVFLLTGFWHGANYTFIVWGMIHGSLLLVERGFLGKIPGRFPLFFKRLYVFVMVVLAWVPFRSANMTQALNYWKSMIPNGKDLKVELVASYFTTDMIVALGVAVILAFNLPAFFNLEKAKAKFSFMQLVNACFLLAVLFFSAVYLMSGTYNPFIYYQF